MKNFNEELNVAVFTTKFILKEGGAEPILYVYHHEDDGAWEFIGATKALDDSDYRVVALSTIINYDSTVLELANLPLGSKAFRSRMSEPWVISTIE